MKPIKVTIESLINGVDRKMDLLDYSIVCADSSETIRNKIHNNLVLVNHDLPIFDFLVLDCFKNLNITYSVVFDEFFKFLNTDHLIEKYRKRYNFKVIRKNFSESKRSTLDKIIGELKNGGTVVLFFFVDHFLQFNKNDSVKKIMDETGCKPVMMNYRTRVPFMKTVKRKQSTKKKNILGFRFSNIQLLGLWTMVRLLFVKKIRFYITISERFGEFSELDAAKNAYLKPLVVC